MPIWICPFCSEKIVSIDSEEIYEEINRHLATHQPFYKKIFGFLFPKKKEQEVNKIM